IPIFPISNVTGDNYGAVLKYLSKIEPKVYPELRNNPKEFMINDICIIQDIGIIVSGIVLGGTINLGDKLMIGPIDNVFYPTTIKSVHRKQIDCKYIQTMETGSLELLFDSHTDINLIKKINKHLMLVDNQLTSNITNSCYIKFTTSIDKIKIASQYTMYLCNI